MRIGYGRVCTRDQHPEAQADALATAGCDEVFIDKASGTLARRPELEKALLAANRTGDQLVVTKLDRLGRSLEHVIELSEGLRAERGDLVVLDQGIDTSPAVGRPLFSVIGAIAEFEHALMSERTIEALTAARARGRTGGQKPKLGPRQVKLACQMYEETDDDNHHTVAQIAAEFGITAPPSSATSPRATHPVPGTAVRPAPIPRHSPFPTSPTPTSACAVSAQDETGSTTTVTSDTRTGPAAGRGGVPARGASPSAVAPGRKPVRGWPYSGRCPIDSWSNE